MTDYRVGFRALAGEPLADAAVERLTLALRTLPGIGAVRAVDTEPGTALVSASFVIDVRLGMADAARDGSRLAKEALKVAGMGSAKLVALSVTINDDPVEGTAG